jgi:secreted PhoX family phosphatase
VGAIKFASDGTILDAYSILTGMFRNCAGGPTPRGTWLSAEEFTDGTIWECDPFTPGSQGTEHAAMGAFFHEAAAVDPVNETVYMTEDVITGAGNGLLYRYTSTSYPDLSAGTLEAAEILGAGAIAPGEVRSLAWHVIPDPTPAGGGVQNGTHLPAIERATRFQLTAPTPFDGGEGSWYEAASANIFFATKGDNRVWKLDTAAQTIEIYYDLATTTMPNLSGCGQRHRRLHG